MLGIPLALLFLEKGFSCTIQIYIDPVDRVSGNLEILVNGFLYFKLAGSCCELSVFSLIFLAKDYLGID